MVLCVGLPLYGKEIAASWPGSENNVLPTGNAKDVVVWEAYKIFRNKK